MNNPLVSVIVPIYKTEAYLDQCIRSVVEQSYSNLEILLLDDGSPDRCPAICDSWEAQDIRVRVIHKSNTGVSNTRNTGLAMAKGKYITFLDSDDYLETNAIAVMLSKAEEYQAECVLAGYKRLLRDGTSAEHPVIERMQICDDHKKVEGNILRRLIGAECKGIVPLHYSACMKLYNRQKLIEHKVSFLPIREIGSEDFFFNICWFEHVEKAVLIPESIYIYRDNGESCSNTYNAERVNSFIKLFQAMYEKNPLVDRKEYLHMLSGNVLGGISVCVKLLIASDSPCKIKQLSELLENEEIRRMLDCCDVGRIRFPLNLFSALMKFKMKYTLLALITLFVRLNLERK